MSTAEIGDRVRIQYCRLPERAAARGGTRHQNTIEFTVGSREVFHGLSAGVVGMAPGDRKQFSLRQVEPCGSVNRGLVRKIRRDQIPEHVVLYVGKRLSRLPGSAGRPRRVAIAEIQPDAIIVEGNHPLAGKLIELEVCLLSLERHRLLTAASSISISAAKVDRDDYFTGMLSGRGEKGVLSQVR